MLPNNKATPTNPLMDSSIQRIKVAPETVVDMVKYGMLPDPVEW